MTQVNDIRLFVSRTHDCNYLDGQEATVIFVDPDEPIDTSLYTALSAAGFRRSGPYIYRPHCQDCEACVPVRVPVRQFTPRRRHKRILKRNQHMSVTCDAPQMTDENLAIYQRYICKRHADGSMYPPSAKQFESFLAAGRPDACFYNFRDRGELVAVAVADVLEDGLSAIYTFFDPSYERAAPGVFAILWLIEETQRLGLDYLYLGYWIEQCAKMSYKTDYRPFELYRDGEWIGIEG